MLLLADPRAVLLLVSLGRVAVITSPLEGTDLAKYVRYVRKLAHN